jgi:hypothetical protein
VARGRSEDRLIIVVLQSVVADVGGLVTVLAQDGGEGGRQRVVDQEPHSPAANGSARSRTASAAKSRASRTSAASRSG